MVSKTTAQKLTNLNIILVGPPGSGKGTIAHEITQQTPLKHVGMGDLLREEAKKKTQLGKHIKQLVDSGTLVNDELAFTLLKKRVKGKGWVFDGFPRTLHQARILHQTYPIDLVIILKVPKRELLRRLSNRRIGKDGKIYNLVTLKHLPKNQTFTKRNDDNPKVIDKRLDRHKKRSRPVINYFKTHDRIVTINANRTIPEIVKDVLTVLRKR